MSVKILNLLPVTGDVLTPEMFKYMCKYLESDTAKWRTRKHKTA